MAGTANVSLTATTGNITDSGDAHADVVANGLRMTAGGNIGEPAGTNAHLDTTVTAITADATGSAGIFVTNSQAVTVAEVDTVIVKRVDTASATANQADNANQSDLVTQTNNGSIVLVTSTGNLTVTDGGNSDDDVAGAGDNDDHDDEDEDEDADEEPHIVKAI